MNTMKNTQGFTILDVLLGIVIFVVGMLAMMHLQTNLTRSSSDANVRTVATNIGEEILEEVLAYRRITTDPDGALLAFADIDDDYVSRSVTRGNLEFTTTGEVIGYTFDDDRVSLTATDPAVAGAVYDFKVIELSVSWDNAGTFQVDEGQQLSSADMGTGSVTIRKIVPSIPSLGSAKLAADDDGKGGIVPVVYVPGEIPDIVPIELVDGEVSKESTDPQPDVIRRDETVETWFDVVTYGQANPNQFLRREEFLVVACECALNAATGTPSAFEPTTWTGTEYSEADFVSKPWGEPTNLAQSFYCSTCCRDHHDSSSSTDDTVYDPRKDWTSAPPSGGDHYHYGKDNRGDLLDDPAADGDDYLEVCRLVRKDGFMRVTQDFRQEGLIAVPQSYFEDINNVDSYSDYVTGALDAYLADYLNGGPVPNLQSANDYGLTLPGDADDNRVAMAEAGNLDSLPDEGQLVSRGVYIDHFTAEAADLIECLTPVDLGGEGNTAEFCGVEPGLTYREVIPFFEVQLTWLSWWSEDSNNDPVTVTNDALEDDNTHSRGYAEVVSAVADDVSVDTDIHRGNNGLSATEPIDHLYFSNGMAETSVLLAANGGDNDPPETGIEFSGSITSAVGGVSATDVTFQGEGVSCTLNVTEFTCWIDLFATAPTLTISGYWKNATTDLYVCDNNGTYAIEGTPVQSSPKSTTFNLTPAKSGGDTGVSFTIYDSPCN